MALRKIVSAQEILNRDMQATMDELGGELQQMKRTVEILEKRLEALEVLQRGEQSSS